MAVTITPKENYLRLYKGEMPQYIPRWSMGMNYGPETPAVMAGARSLAKNAPDFFFGSGGPPPEKWTNEWGVTMVANAESGYGGLPEPGNFILDDITKWDKVIKKPELKMGINEFDWEAMAKESMKDIDREKTGVVSFLGNGVFQFIVGFMGFNEALIALVEEPEACEEFFAWADEYFVPIAEKTIQYWKPDIAYIGDDSASKYAPFVSPATYRRLLKPSYARASKFAMDRDIPVQFHNCGKAEAYLDDMYDFGVRFWDPAQTENDLLGVKEKFPNGKIVVVGGYDFVPPPDNVVTEEAVRESVRSTIDKLAPGGGWAWMGMYLGQYGEERAPVINNWITDEVVTYGMNYYDKH